VKTRRSSIAPGVALLFAVLAGRVVAEEFVPEFTQEEEEVLDVVTLSVEDPYPMSMGSSMSMPKSMSSMGSMSKPKSMAKKPASMAKKPASMAKKPASMAKKPASMAKKPASMAKKPASMAKKPASMAKKPASMAKKPASMAKKPASMAKKPASMAKKPASMAKTPASMGASDPKLSSGDQSSLNWIIQHESGGKTSAKNPSSTAFGLGQLLIANRQKYAKALGVSPDTTNYNDQLKMMEMYIKDRYGSPTAAKAFWEQHHWY